MRIDSEIIRFGRAAHLNLTVPEVMQRNRDHATAMRSTLLRALGAEVLGVGEFELATAHLRAPELV